MFLFKIYFQNNDKHHQSHLLWCNRISSEVCNLTILLKGNIKIFCILKISNSRELFTFGIIFAINKLECFIQNKVLRLKNLPEIRALSVLKFYRFLLKKA